MRFDRPFVSEPPPIPLALLRASEPVEVQVARDTRASKVGLWCIVVLMPLGYFACVAMTPDVKVARTLLLIMALPVVMTVCLALIGTRSHRSFAVEITVGMMFSFVLAASLIVVAM